MKAGIDFIINLSSIFSLDGKEIMIFSDILLNWEDDVDNKM